MLDPTEDVDLVSGHSVIKLYMVGDKDVICSPVPGKTRFLKSAPKGEKKDRSMQHMLHKLDGTIQGPLMSKLSCILRPCTQYKILFCKYKSFYVSLNYYQKVFQIREEFCKNLKRKYILRKPGQRETRGLHC